MGGERKRSITHKEEEKRIEITIQRKGGTRFLILSLTMRKRGEGRPLNGDLGKGGMEKKLCGLTENPPRKGWGMGCDIYSRRGGKKTGERRKKITFAPRKGF